MPQPPSKGGLQPQFFAPFQGGPNICWGQPSLSLDPYLARLHAVSHIDLQAGLMEKGLSPIGLITVKDLPSRQPTLPETRHHLASKPPTQQVCSPGIVTRASQEHTRKEACVADWQEILNLLGSASGLQSSLANPQALLKKSLEKFTAGTLERYIGAAKHFLDFLGLSSRSVDSLDVPFLADFLHACENSLEEDREVCKIGPKPILKALSWLSRNAEVSALQPLLQTSLIRAFVTQPTTDRKEALPLPLAVVVEWEKYISSPHCPQDLRLFLGGLLLALHGGL